MRLMAISIGEIIIPVSVKLWSILSRLLSDILASTVRPFKWRCFFGLLLTTDLTELTIVQQLRIIILSLSIIIRQLYYVYIYKCSAFIFIYKKQKQFKSSLQMSITNSAALPIGGYKLIPIYKTCYNNIVKNTNVYFTHIKFLEKSD